MIIPQKGEYNLSEGCFFILQFVILQILSQSCCHV